MKLNTITVCVHYSDYLCRVIDNRRHFDRWIVITASSDVLTQRLCDKAGIECMISSCLSEAGREFNAAYYKAPVLNEVLDFLPGEGWVLVIDSDVLLPLHFRKRLETLPLEEDCLYGVSGRRICLTPQEFDILRPREPWLSSAKNTQPLGYFNLFRADGTVCRYPELGKRDVGVHDDLLFTYQFARSKRKLLPMNVLHVGPIGRNWSYRLPDTFDGVFGRVHERREPLKQLQRLVNSEGSVSACFIGFYYGGVWEEIVVKCSKPFLIDSNQIFSISSDSIVEADRSAIRNLLRGTLARTPGFRIVPFHEEALSLIPDGSVNLLYFCGDIDSASLLPSLPLLTRKLKETAIIAGAAFGASENDATSACICHAFGSPDELTPTGEWSLRTARRPAEEHETRPGDQITPASRGVVIWDDSLDRVDAVISTIVSARNHWDGSIQVIHWGEHSQALHLACHRFRCDLCLAGSIPSEFEQQLDWAAAELHPFGEAIVLQAGTLVIGQIDMRSIAGSTVENRDGSTGALLARTLDEGVSIEHLRTRSARDDVAVGGAGPVFVRLDCGIEMWSEAVWQAVLENRSRLAALASTVRVRPDATAVVVVTTRSIVSFNESVLMWRFNVPVAGILFLIGVSPSDIRTASCFSDIKVIQRGVDENLSGLEILRVITDTVASDYIMFLPPSATPLPGAELWSAPEWSKYVACVHSPRWVVAEERLTGNLFVPEDLFCLIQREFLREFVAEAQKAFVPPSSMALLVQIAGLSDSPATCIVDASEMRWSVSCDYVFVPARIQHALQRIGQSHT